MVDKFATTIQTENNVIIRNRFSRPDMDLYTRFSEKFKLLWYADTPSTVCVRIQRVYEGYANVPSGYSIE